MLYKLSNNACPRIVIFDVAGNTIAIGRPIEARDLTDVKLIHALTHARTQNRNRFLSQFSATPERTRAWMSRIVNAKNQLLFLIEIEGKCVGHYGVIIENENSVELDNSILMDQDVPKGFMSHVENAILGFAFGYLLKNMAFGRVLSNNFACVAMHQAAGLRLHRDEPLFGQTLENGDLLLETSNVNNVENAVAQLLHLSITASEYWQIRQELGYRKPVEIEPQMS